MISRPRPDLFGWILRGAVPVALLLAACGGAELPRTVVVQPQLLPLELDPVAGPAEFSGLCWWGDDLLILPQFATGPESQGVLVLARDSIARAIGEARAGGEVRPLRPRRIPVDATGLVDSIPDYDGLEALVIDGDLCFALAEYGNDRGDAWGSRILSGKIERGDGALRLSRLGPVRLEGPQMRRNFTHESLVLVRGEVWVLPELNGPGVVDRPELLRFDRDLDLIGRQPLPPLEYRVTDATGLGPDGRFWVLDIYWPEDIATIRPGEGRVAVERLVPLRVVGDSVVEDPERPILDLRDDPGRAMRNWEGVARWGDEGFLLVTDSYPADLLAYVARPR